MIVGILSDTHGNVAGALAAVRLLVERGATYLVHCGDVCGENVLDALAGVPSAFVFGNNDYDRVDLARYGHLLGIRCLGDGGLIELEGKRIAVTHGDNAGVIAQLTAPTSNADYLLTGHSHRVHDKRLGTVRWINPGALYRAKVKTVATLDLASDTVEWTEVPGA